MQKSLIAPLMAGGLLFLALGSQSHPTQSHAQQPRTVSLANNEHKPAMRYFLFSSRPNAKAWQMMKENPGDRQAATADAMKKIGCEMLAYYWGLGNGRNYTIVAAPDNPTVQALIVKELASGLLHEYEAIELVRSSDMVAMFARLKEIEAADDTLAK